MSTPAVMALSAVAIVVLMLATWLVSLVRHDASIVDIVWGLGFVVVAWVVRLAADGDPLRQNLLTALVTIWGLRLSLHLLWRNAGTGEDDRYQSMRRRAPDRFWLVSLYLVFGLQGVLMWTVSLPVQAGQVPTSAVGWLAWVGFAVWVVGMAFESLGDLQLARFKADPHNAGKVMDQGLWGWTRHPNYFGDCCVWWGVYLVAADSRSAWWTIVGPIVMTVLLTRVSGKPMLERGLVRRRPGYDDYIARTSGFIPRPPRREAVSP